MNEPASSVTTSASDVDVVAGGAGIGPVSTEDLVRDLASFDRGTGLLGRDLVTTHHRADSHAVAMVDLLEGLEVGRG